MMLALCAFGAVLVTGMTAGGLAFMAGAVTTVTPRLPAPVFVRLHRALYHMADPLMPIMVCLSGLIGVPLVGLLLAAGQPVQAGIAGCGVAGILGVIAITETVNKPINKLVDAWRPERLPSQLARVRDRWNRFHAYRTAAGLLSYGGYLAVALAVLEERWPMNNFSYIGLLFVGLAAGGLAFMYAVVGRACRGLDATSYTTAHQAFISSATAYMTVLTIAATLGAGATLFAITPSHDAVATTAAASAVLATVAVIAISVLINVPINRRIAKWTPARPPADWAAVRTRWMRFHLVRVVAAVGAFALLIVAVERGV
jgi:uncharacterized membrane protein